jgi:hypothetical protein
MCKLNRNCPIAEMCRYVVTTSLRVSQKELLEITIGYILFNYKVTAQKDYEIWDRKRKTSTALTEAMERDMPLYSDETIHHVYMNQTTALFKLIHILYITMRMLYCINSGVRWKEILL